VFKVIIRFGGNYCLCLLGEEVEGGCCPIYSSRSASKSGRVGHVAIQIEMDVTLTSIATTIYLTPPSSFLIQP
jgi:hypothetical protein